MRSTPLEARRDGRQLDHKTLSELRRRGVAAVQEGQSPSQVAAALGVQRVTVYNWLALYRQGGWDALEAKKRGGRRPKVGAKALRWIYDTVTMKNPLQLKFTFALWTSKMIAELIRRKFGISLSKASVCRLLNQMGLSPQRPLWRAYQQRAEDVQRWLDEEYPRIRRLARREKATIYFGDEAGVRSDHHAGTTWGVRGKTPVVSSTGARFGMNMISAVSAQGEFRFMTVKGRVNARVFIQYLRRLLHNAARPVFLIVDRHPSHRAKMVAKFVEAQKGRLRLFFLPPYSPELNPDECVWNDLKNNTVGRQAHATAESLKSQVIGFMQLLAKTPGRVQGYFNNETTRYAAAV